MLKNGGTWQDRESGVFGSLMLSKNHSSNSFTGPVLGSVVPASLSPLELDTSQLQVAGKCMPPVAICTGMVKESNFFKKGFVSEGAGYSRRIFNKLFLTCHPVRQAQEFLLVTSFC